MVDDISWTEEGLNHPVFNNGVRNERAIGDRSLNLIGNFVDKKGKVYYKDEEGSFINAKYTVLEWKQD